MRPDDPWATDEADFPKTASVDERLRFLIAYAVLAPSGHNTQPWLFRIEDGVVEMFADRTRALPVVDPEDRELTISCGAALRNLEISAARFRLVHEVELLPKSNDPDLLARLRVTGTAEPDVETRRLFLAIPHRRTTRLRFEPRRLPDDVLAGLTAKVEALGAGLKVAESEELRGRVARIVEEGDHRQFASSSFRRELALWIHRSRAKSRDGIALQGPEFMSPVAAWFVRTFDLGHGRAAHDRDLARHSPILSVLFTPGDTPHDWLVTGRALADLTLGTTAAGATTAYLNQPIEVSELRAELGELLAVDGIPQMLIRLGYAPRIPPAARRPVGDVVLPAA